MNDTEPKNGMEHVRAFVALSKDAATAEEALKEAKQKMQRLEPFILDFFQANGIQRVACDDRVVHQRRDIRAFAKPDQKETLIRSMEQRPDMQYMVSKGFNTQTFWAWIRELPRDDRDMPILPTPMETMVDVKEVLSVRCVTG